MAGDGRVQRPDALVVALHAVQAGVASGPGVARVVPIEAADVERSADRVAQDRDGARQRHAGGGDPRRHDEHGEGDGGDGDGEDDSAHGTPPIDLAAGPQRPLLGSFMAKFLLSTLQDVRELSSGTRQVHAYTRRVQAYTAGPRSKAV